MRKSTFLEVCRLVFIVFLVLVTHLGLLHVLNERPPYLVSGINTIIFAVLFLISGRFKFSLCVPTFSTLFISIAGATKERMLGMPFLYNDIYYFLKDLKANSATLIHYPKMSIAALLILLALAGVMYLIYKLDKPIPTSKSVRQMTGILTITPMLWATHTFLVKPIHKENWKAMWVLFQDYSYSTKFYSSIFMLANQGLTLPTNSSVGATSVFATKTDSQKNETLNKRPPNIFAILHESAFDLSTLKDCPADFCDLNLFKVDKNTSQSGFLNVHVKGGGTWLSEFAFLTGLDYRLFGNAGFYAPYTVVPKVKHSLAKFLKGYGYRTIAIYPVSGNFLHAKNAYKHYGFDEFYSTDDLDLPTDWLAVTDGLLYQKALEKTQSLDQPTFVFVLTIQNHGPYERFLENREIIKHPKTETDSKYIQLETYRQRYQQSLNDIVKLEEHLLSQKTDTVILRFGDHQPAFTSTMNDIEFTYPNEYMKDNPFYYTKYIIKSNFIKANATDMEVDIAFLGSSLIHHSGLKINDLYFAANSTFSDSCGKNFLHCDDKAQLDSFLNHIFFNLNTYEQ